MNTYLLINVHMNKCASDILVLMFLISGIIGASLVGAHQLYVRNFPIIDFPLEVSTLNYHSLSSLPHYYSSTIIRNRIDTEAALN